MFYKVLSAATSYIMWREIFTCASHFLNRAQKSRVSKSYPFKSSVYCLRSTCMMTDSSVNHMKRIYGKKNVNSNPLQDPLQLIIVNSYYQLHCTRKVFGPTRALTVKNIDLHRRLFQKMQVRVDLPCEHKFKLKEVQVNRSTPSGTHSIGTSWWHWSQCPHIYACIYAYVHAQCTQTHMHMLVWGMHDLSAVYNYGNNCHCLVLTA